MSGQRKRGIVMSELIPKEEAELDVHIVASRLAMLYYYFVTHLKDKLGEEETRALVRDVIADYGADCGRQTRAAVKKLGYPNELPYQNRGGDLPKNGWHSQVLKSEIDEKLVRNTHCPFAATWKEYDFCDWGRLYCYVDQAKYAAYNDQLTCVHEENILDGCASCLLHITKSCGLEAKT